MKKESTGKKASNFLSVAAAVIVAVLFWLVVQYIDAGSLTADLYPDIFGGIL